MNAALRRLAICITVGGWMLAAATGVSAGIFVEPELGVRVPTGDAADILDSGLLVGGTGGFEVSPGLSIILRGDLSFHHSAAGPLAHIDNGFILGFGVGGRLSPMAANSDQAIQPYVAGELGLTVMGWSFESGYVLIGNDGIVHDSDGMAAFSTGFEGGARFPVSDRVGLGLAATYRHHFWANETADGLRLVAPNGKRFAGDELGVTGRLTFTFDL